MNLEIKITLGDTTCTAGLDAIPGPVLWAGDSDLIEGVKFRLKRAYGAYGHPLDLQYASAADLVAAIGLLYGDDAELLKGKAALEREHEEVAQIEAEGGVT